MSSIGVTATRAPGVRVGRLQTIVVMVVVASAIAAAAFLLDTRTGYSTVDLKGDTSGPRPAIGQPIVDFTAKTTDGTDISLSSLRGKAVWLTLGATWCPDCRAEAPDLQATAAKYRDQGLVVVGVFISETGTQVSEYARRVGWDFTMVPDPDTAIASRYRVMGLPTHIFIDRDGVIRDMRLGGLRADVMDQLAQSIVK